MLVLALKPGQSTVEPGDPLFQALNVQLALPQEVTAAGQETEVSRRGLILPAMGAHGHEKVGGRLQIIHVFLKKGGYLPVEARIPDNQAGDMILEIDLD